MNLINSEVLILGAIAGFTIYLGLPLALMKVSDKTKGALNSLAIGILLFLFVDIVHEGIEIIENPFNESLIGTNSIVNAMVYPAILFLGFCIGLLGLVYYESRFVNSDETKNIDKAKRLAMMISIGIGLHNFSEGLAIGQSYAGGAISLAVTLVIGFGLHNMTEGFGIAGPLNGIKPSFRYLAALGFISGFPTFFGTVIGSFFVSEIISVFFLALSGGSIIYVIKELLYHGKTNGDSFESMFAIVLGLIMGIVSLLFVHFWIE